MNKTKFNLYNILGVKSEDIPLIASYIINNQIYKLPRTLKHSNELYLALLTRNCPFIFKIDFDKNIYNQNNIDMFDKDYQNIIHYIIYNNIPTNEIPDVIKNNGAFLNALIENDSVKLALDIIDGHKELYDQLDKEQLAYKLLEYDYNVFNVNEFIRKDTELLNLLINESDKYKAATIDKNPFSIIEFDGEAYKSIGHDRIIEILEKTYTISEKIPAYFKNDQDLFKAIIEDHIIDLSIKERIISQIIRENNTDALNTFFQVLFNEPSLSIASMYRRLNKQIIADYIINNQVKNIVNNEVIRYIENDEELFKMLLDRNYNNIIRLPFEERLYRTYSDKIYRIFENDSMEDGINFEALKVLSEIPLVSTQPDNIKKIGNYLVSHKDEDLMTPVFKKNIDLFNYLYSLDIDNLYQLGFDNEVYQKVPMEKLKDYYKRHPQKLPPEISGYMTLEISSDLKPIDYQKIKPVLLIEQRRMADYEMHKYSNLGIRLCNLLKKEGTDALWGEYQKEFQMASALLNLSFEEFNDIILRYLSNPSMYEEEINNLARRFYATKKEQLALDATESRLNYIKNAYTKEDERELLQHIRKNKRKMLYINHFTDALSKGTLSENEKKIIELIEKLNISKYKQNPILLLNALLEGQNILEIPESYNKKDVLKIYRRLKGNYEPLLNKIIIGNPQYQDKIIKYLQGEYEHIELRKEIAPKDLNILKEIKDLCKQIGVSIKIDNNKIIFDGDYNLTEEQERLNNQYEANLKIINTLNKLVNTEISSSFSLDTIAVSENEKYETKEKYGSLKYYIDYSRIDKYGISKMAYIFDSIKMLNDEHARKLFNKLFFDTNLVYAIPFLDISTIKQIDLIIENFDYVCKNFKDSDMTLENIEKIAKRIETYKYVKPSDLDILGYDNAYKIIFNETFIYDTRPNDKKERIANASKYTSLASKNNRSTIPYITVLKNGIKGERYKSNDPSLLVAGIDTDACFRISGNDNDFLLYTMFNKNGFVLKLTDEKGEFIGRISGFRNGNTLFLNQARSIMDVHGNPNMVTLEKIKAMRECIEEYARRIVEETKNTEEPIEYVLILKAYGYSDCDYLPVVSYDMLKDPNNPMNIDSPDYQEFAMNDELKINSGAKGFQTDYYKDGLPILLLASRDGLTIDSPDDIKEYDAKAAYDSPRIKPQIYTKIDESIIAKINSINARNIYWGDSDTRKAKKAAYKSVENLSNIVATVIGEDFYIAIDKDGNTHEMCLQYDKRAQEEFEKYKQIILEEYKNSNTNEQTSNKKR